MKANELMIGNLIYRPCCTDKVVEIRSNGIIGCDKLRGLIQFSEIEPIKITEEWLMKNGFAKIGGIDNYGIEVYNKVLPDATIEIRKNCSNTIGRDWCCHIDNQDCQGIACADVQYVNQLQNLLNILEIKSVFEI